MKLLYILYDFCENIALYTTYDKQKLVDHIGEIAANKDIFNQNIHVIIINMDRVDE